MREIQLCMAYFENPGMLERQYKLLASMPDEIRSRIKLTVVDDCSPKFPAKAPNFDFDVRFKIFRLLTKVPWNQDACRNLAVKYCISGWVLLTDMDHMVPKETWEHIMSAPLAEDTAYKFTRVNDPKMEPYKSHPNSFLLTKNLYDKVGGYDERFAGVYGTDGRFRNMLATIAHINDLPCPLIRVPREVTPDASTTTYSRNSEENDKRKVQVRAEIARSGKYKPVTLTFPWEQVV